MTERITTYITRELLSRREGEPSVEEEQDLLGSGLLDSLGVMSLVYFLETEFGIDIPPEDVTIEHFNSVRTIAAYLEGRTNPTAEPTG